MSKIRGALKKHSFISTVFCGVYHPDQINLIDVQVFDNVVVFEMYVHIFTEVNCEMSNAKVFCPFVQVPLQLFSFVTAQCQNTTRRLPAYGRFPQWRVLRSTQQQGPQ